MPLTDKQFSASLREHRERAGLTQHEAAQRLGIPFRTYQNYETATSAPASQTKRQILLDKLDPGTSTAGDEVLVIEGGGTAASGTGRTNDGESVERVVISTSEVFRVTGLVGPPLQDLRWFINAGDSNEPDLRTNERVYYLLADTFAAGGYYVVELDGERIVKKIQRHGGGVLDMIPGNPQYATERLVPIPGADTPNSYRSELSGQVCTLRVVGKVVFNLQPR